MSKFIKLTTLIINTNNIQSIFIKPNKYIIHIVSNKIDGSMWNIAGFGMGTIHSYNYEIEVCEIKHSSDYKIVSHWIDNNSTSYL
jgi:hypothetical protein